MYIRTTRIYIRMYIRITHIHIRMYIRITHIHIQMYIRITQKHTRMYTRMHIFTLNIIACTYGPILAFMGRGTWTCDKFTVWNFQYQQSIIYINTRISSNRHTSTQSLSTSNSISCEHVFPSHLHERNLIWSVRHTIMNPPPAIDQLEIPNMVEPAACSR